MDSTWVRYEEKQRSLLGPRLVCCEHCEQVIPRDERMLVRVHRVSPGHFRTNIYCLSCGFVLGRQEGAPRVRCL